MENSVYQTPCEKTNPPAPAYQTRRRPLKSKSFDVFLHILSECHLHFQKQVQVDEVIENNDLRPEEDELASLVKENREGDHSRLEDGQKSLVVNESREIVTSQDPGFVGDCMDVDGLASLVNENREGDPLLDNYDLRPEDGQKSLVVNESRELVTSHDPGLDVDVLECVDHVKSSGCQDNLIGMESVIDGNRICHDDFAAFASLIDNDDEFILPDFVMEEFGLGEQMGDKAPCVDVSELIDSLFETDATVGFSIPVVTQDENYSHVERNEIETQMEVRESDIPLSASIIVSEGVADGKILEVSGVLEKSSDLVPEDVVSLQKNSVDKGGELSGDVIHNEGLSPNALQIGLEKDTHYFGLSKNGVNLTGTAMNVGMQNDNQNLVENRTKVCNGDTVEDDRAEHKDSRLELGRNRQRSPKEANSQASCPKNITLSGGSTGENTIENQGSASTEKVANQDHRKRKRGGSEEGNAKKKKKERMKRAEKNRELGVNENREGGQLENYDSRPEVGQNSLVVNESRELVTSQDPGFVGDVDGLDCVDHENSGCQDNLIGMESAIEGNQICHDDFAAFASLIDNDDQFSLPDFDMEEFGLGEQIGVKAPCVDVSELIGSLLQTDGTVGFSIPVDTKDENHSHVRRNEIETQMEVRESDTPVSASIMVSEGIEDGEISEVSGVLEKSSDLLHEDVVSLQKKNSVVDEVGELSGDVIQKEGLSPNALQRGLEKDTHYFGLSKNGVNLAGTAMNVGMRNDNQNLVENRTKVYYGDSVEDDRVERKDSRLELGRNRQRCGLKEANSQASCPKKISVRGGLTGENTIENQDNRKRKRGGFSEEAKDKKKKKERMKRAEKNRELGVKRLKLTPMSKPKTVTFCRHFLNGRCHEGEKCKFSHDTVPLTKSKPCCHFARQSCMKGDDCPFDHQLSKYPCNNYLSQGSCNRGSNCLFSHKVSVKEGSSTTSDTCNNDLRFVSAKGNSDLKKQMIPNATCNQNVSTKICSSGVSYCKNEKQNGEGTTLKPAGHEPKGISFLSHGKVPSVNMSKHGQGVLIPKVDNGAKVDQQTMCGASDVVESLNKNAQRTLLKPAGHAPKGISFLSHGKVSSVNMSRHGQGDLIPKVDNGAKVDQQTMCGASDVVESLNKNTQRAPVVPRGVNFMSFGKAPIPNPVLPQVQSSPLGHDRSLSKPVDVKCKSSLSSFQGSLLSNTPSSLQKALHSTLALAAKFESKAKNDRPCNSHAVITDLSKEGSISQNKSTKASTILDFLYGGNGKTKQ